MYYHLLSCPMLRQTNNVERETSKCVTKPSREKKRNQTLYLNPKKKKKLRRKEKKAYIRSVHQRIRELQKPIDRAGEETKQIAECECPPSPFQGFLELKSKDTNKRRAFKIRQKMRVILQFYFVNQTGARSLKCYFRPYFWKKTNVIQTGPIKILVQWFNRG